MAVKLTRNILPKLGGASIEPAQLRAIFLLCFVFASIIGALGKDVTTGFDEIAHISYIAHIQSTGDAWPRLESLRLLDSRTFRFTDSASYLGHPPTYYFFLAQLGPTIEGNPGAVLGLRLLNVLIATIGVSALVRLGASLELSRIEEYAWIVPLLLAPVFLPLAGSVNADNLAIASGSVAALALHRLTATRQSYWLLIATAAMICAGFAKLTGFIMVGGLVAGVLAVMLWRQSCQRWWLPVAAAAALVGGAPYLVFFAQYGSPAPTSPGQIGLLTNPLPFDELTKGATATLSFPAYALAFVKAFIREWEPVATERTPLQLATLAAPVFALICALAGARSAAARLWRKAPSPTDILVVVGLAVAFSTATIHMVFSYRHHVEYAFVNGVPTYSYSPDAYPRYYLPLGAIVPLACLSVLASLRKSWLHTAFASALIAAPIALILLGSPSETQYAALTEKKHGLDIYRVHVTNVSKEAESSSPP